MKRNENLICVYCGFSYTSLLSDMLSFILKISVSFVVLCFLLQSMVTKILMLWSEGFLILLQHGKMTVNFMKVTNPSPAFAHCNASYLIGKDGLLYFNSSIEMFQDMGRAKATVQLFVPNSDTDKGYDKLYFQSMTDLCQLVRGMKTNYFMRAFFEGYTKAGGHVNGE